MSRIVYVNGDYVPEEDAKISVFDRGFLFADAVYEVTTVINRKILEFDGHMTRLRRSLDELDMTHPEAIDELLEIHRQLIERNDLDNGLVYLQVSRGSADRDFLYPSPDTKPTMVLFTQAKDIAESKAGKDGLKVKTVEDQRWGRRDIKTVQLLYPSIAKSGAYKEGFDDAWMEEDGFITEGTSNNAWIVTKEGKIVTRQLSNAILHGITRKSVMRCAEMLQMSVEERPFTKDEVANAQEAFITSASSFVTPVIAIDGKPIGTGQPGKLVEQLRAIYIEEATKAAV